MNPKGVFMNIGRGPTCKEADLVEALKTSKIAAAVLDVFEVENSAGSMVVSLALLEAEWMVAHLTAN
jgi:lactate dehydrogenase-like 2-hydroxyacid dehydrogenase